MITFLIQTPTDKAYVTNAAVSRLFKLVPSGSAEQIRPTWTISDLRRVWMHARNAFLSPLPSVLNMHIKFYVINLLSEAFHLKQTGRVLVSCGYEPLPFIMDFVTSF
jgi:hypothetical protein